jgi:hypothetical protein
VVESAVKGRLAMIFGLIRVSELPGNHLALARYTGRKCLSRAAVISLFATHEEPSGISKNARRSPAALMFVNPSTGK